MLVIPAKAGIQLLAFQVFQSRAGFQLALE
jgi:hypothetical protein